ncbi:Mitochondrial inner membrane translocase protein [Lasiodiplodia theobromae]|uniref:Mitochondrial inner membrane translocase protein n=1 Tax=Lasiodiplodia theobromae TaxID=45133 RepID=UPI0015C4081A|nr:Mitochondrial inner membrane translocase protein [Lasiodiplodia theobromae]KAF4545234.1 Mitochondrial inner membrane translocase protein [Lasiodiplodia theobromae]
MVAAKRKAKKPGLLSHGRSPHINTQKTAANISAKATATIIRTHHQLQKAHAQAVKAGDHAKAAEIQKKIDEQGGLKTYQAASITGQSSERGGDSSRVLVDWLQELGLPSAYRETERGDVEGRKCKLLEVGALSTENACSKRRYLAVERIDLHSQAPGILQQDFMERPLAASDKERFDIISLSLVLNYVPDAEGRGEMLKRTRTFLRRTRDLDHDGAALAADLPTPCLFLVLPAPCVTNSRYLDRQRLEQIMNSLGYVMLREKITAKLIYQLWKLAEKKLGKDQKFPKVEVNPGVKRNNFCVIVK